MKIGIISVPHTGTHFIANLFNAKFPLLHAKPQTNDDNTILYHHPYVIASFEKLDSEGYALICPMRHPMVTMRSWINWQDSFNKQDGRIQNIPNLENTTSERAEWNIDPERVPMLYKNLIWGSELYDVNFIPIDSPVRQKYLDKLNKKLKTNIATEWKPLNSIGKHYLDIPPYYKSLVNNLINENINFFKQFYPDVTK
jgi:hypothetical protein